MDKYMYPSLKARIQAEYKIYLLAFRLYRHRRQDRPDQNPLLVSAPLFIFPIFYSLILGILSGPAASQRLLNVQRSQSRIQTGYRGHSVPSSQSSASTPAPSIDDRRLRRSGPAAAGIRQIWAPSCWPCRIASAAGPEARGHRRHPLHQPGDQPGPHAPTCTDSDSPGAPAAAFPSMS